SNQPPSEAKDEIWLQWDDFVGAIQSFDRAVQALIEAATTNDPRVAGGAFRAMTQLCKFSHQQCRED
ncbi:cytochrome c, partial [Alloalcanivorax venustensis]|uniref:cytochrome c n=1 Tax=Alloalcanivorax venustensis TaxID=172371 RepID=UPI003C4827C1